MRLLVLDTFFPRRDSDQTDMYVALSEAYDLILDGNVFDHILKQDYDILFLGARHHRMPLDWDYIFYLNTKPVIVDQADNEEFVADKMNYAGESITILSRHLPHEELSGYCATKGYYLKWLPRFIDYRRYPYNTNKKTCDIFYVCSMYDHRIELRDMLYSICDIRRHTRVIGNYYGKEYAYLMSKCRVVIIECYRKCLTMKYLEASLCGCKIIGDVPERPQTNIAVLETNLKNRDEVEANIVKSLSLPLPGNREFVMDTFANKSWFLEKFKQIL